MKKTLHASPKYLSDAKFDHLRTLRKRVKDALRNKGRSDLIMVKLKVILFPFLYIGLFITTLMVYSNSTLFILGNVLLGISLVIIFLTVIHEVSHDNVFKKKWLNHFFLHFFDILGANSFIWKKRHRLMHHNYPNINGWDTDIEQSKLFKVFPNAPQNSIHNYQHIFMFVLYPLYLFNWLLIRDFKDFFSKRSTIKKMIQIPRIEYIKLFIFKFFYLLYMFLIPIFLFNIPVIQVFAGFIILTSTASILSLIVLLPPHANIQNEFPEVDNNYQVSSTWFEHQLKTTTDISNHNWFISFFMGNFNYHIAHHLFPNLSYSELKIATKVIMQYTQKNNLPYKQFSLLKSLKNHYLLIKSNAHRDSIFDETL